MGSISRMIYNVKFTLFFLLLATAFIYIQIIPDHERTHQAIFKSFLINDSYIIYNLNGGFTYYNHFLCPVDSQCWKTQEQIELLKPESDGRYMRFVLGGFLIILFGEVAISLIKHRREEQ